ncbi:carbamoyl phosphate synthase large subunit [Candidatus Curtissbacteria bacterium RIFCSPHIGHO2_02_FULL_42_15]|uniref:Carbamoyl phosphate synthase pyrimidine-specific large chain n=1 Tax=Candidatus Curtissbacteria bacterium RIFCSPHIGHO2_02_FULL_42_15 TaxID=1797716 RepID=A0A1F5GII5_9BACT|nr:MAG: carbamoyl phosphate synthase large subunit [Candidatus Curtissbacteria bacterium RIFCSPHIGHO2_02_FULL_42_15]
MKILILGSGALKIGQAGEFDYSGSQAIKALKEEGHQVILINPNVATIQTSENFANKVYFLPVEPHFVQKVIEKEKPAGILLAFGGQTALNCGLSLSKSGVFKKHKVEILGTPIEAIEKTENRHFFSKTLEKINLLIPKSAAASNLKNAKEAAQKIGYPVMIRAGYSLGGQDSGVAKNQKELEEIVKRALSKLDQVLIEEYLSSWKEIEYEVVRDRFDNCITVCNMENFDPMGIHTGESIVIAPSQTLNNFEYHKLREIAIKVIRHLGIIGECNIQFALNPSPSSGESTKNSLLEPSMNNSEKAKGKNGWTSINGQQLDYRIIEVNARLSRSSALASKATGYPLAYIAAKLALGHSLVDLKNTVTKKTTAAFEPALDYVVVKIPRWDLGKFLKSEAEIGSYMQSVGEVMAIGRKFEEALQKAVRMLDLNLEGILDENAPKANWQKPTPWRLFSTAQAINRGASSRAIYSKTGIDPFFLEKIRNIADLEKELQGKKQTDRTRFLIAKQYGFSDKRIAKLTNSTEENVRNLRHELNIRPSVKQIDTLAAEYPAHTNYLYLTYNGESDDITGGINGRRVSNRTRSVIVLGSGPYRIGSSVEFDWCSVTCAQTVAQNKLLPIIVNCNPETVSTDYDMADRLYFDELSLETILEIYHMENPEGVIVSMGGQTPNNLADKLSRQNVKILGTDTKSIDRAEDRSKFSRLCDELSIKQPKWAKLKTLNEAVTFAQKIGYPVLVRPSYVLSGAAMNVAFTSEDLREYLKLASHISLEFPVVISKFHQDAKEIEIDAVSKNGKILTFAITEHIENAGIHSGDSTIVLPTQKVNSETLEKIKKIAQQLSSALKITGPFNIQFLAIKNTPLVIECNLRASRSLPFVSKVSGVNFAKVATEAILDKPSSFILHPLSLNYVGVKSPQFSFQRIKGADPILRVEMASTGEVACFGDDVNEAFLKSIIATGVKLPQKSVFISLAGDENKIEFLESARTLEQLGLKIFATEGTSKFLEKNKIKTTKLYKIHEKKKPNVLDFLNSKKIDLVINIFDPYFKKEFDDDYLIRRTTIDFGVELLANMQTAKLFVSAISQKKLTDLKILPWDYYLSGRE